MSALHPIWSIFGLKMPFRLRSRRPPRRRRRSSLRCQMPERACPRTLKLQKFKADLLWMHEREIPAGDGPEVAMPRYGITDIADFAEKIRFSLLLLSPRVLVEKIREAAL